jgi:hypothetical protein
MYNDFKKMAHDFNEDYGSGLFYDDEEQENLVGVECPFCGEPIYYDDWDEDESWFRCPICLNEGEDGEYEYEYEDEDEETEDW